MVLCERGAFDCGVIFFSSTVNYRASSNGAACGVSFAVLILGRILDKHKALYSNYYSHAKFYKAFKSNA